MKDIYGKTKRISVTFRLHPDTIEYLKMLQERNDLSKAKVIENLVFDRIIKEDMAKVQSFRRLPKYKNNKKQGQQGDLYWTPGVDNW